MNSSRKSHRKTRTGCSLCKKRKIKCDEQKPQCNNCIKHSVQCDFLLRTTSVAGSPNDNSIHSTTSVHSHVQSPSAPLDGSNPPMNESSMSLNLTDLELLHNFTTQTFSTLAFDPLLRNLWRINVPQLAFNYGFVMRGILAVSALHLAYYKPSKREYYLAQAMRQHQTALNTGIGMLSNVTEENCSAIYIFSVLTFFFTLGSPRKAGHFLLIENNGIAEWLYLLRGTRTIVESCLDALRNGILGPMFRVGDRRLALYETAPGLEQLSELGSYAKNSCTDPEKLQVYLGAIEELDRSFALIYNSGVQSVETAHIFLWVFRISEEYLQLLREGSQEALAIFAYGCVLLKHLDCHWWMDGWSTHLISRTYYLLDEEHRLWIRWPIEEIGWIPGQEDVSMT
ncbi:C6 zinc finger protein [Phlyctema vagabunda]|uniref:C6 zinc finger protein n=1 Tax=Phlyctema vagabunda TaxID=108571 RepID=A0ABR4PQ89_9HELO